MSALQWLKGCSGARGQTTATTRRARRVTQAAPGSPAAASPPLRSSGALATSAFSPRSSIALLLVLLAGLVSDASVSGSSRPGARTTDDLESLTRAINPASTSSGSLNIATTSDVNVAELLKSLQRLPPVDAAAPDPEVHATFTMGVLATIEEAWHITAEVAGEHRFDPAWMPGPEQTSGAVNAALSDHLLSWVETQLSSLLAEVPAVGAEALGRGFDAGAQGSAASGGPEPDTPSPPLHLHKVQPWKAAQAADELEASASAAAGGEGGEPVPAATGSNKSAAPAYADPMSMSLRDLQASLAALVRQVRATNDAAVAFQASGADPLTGTVGGCPLASEADPFTTPVFACSEEAAQIQALEAFAQTLDAAAERRGATPEDLDSGAVDGGRVTDGVPMLMDQLMWPPGSGISPFSTSRERDNYARLPPVVPRPRPGDPAFVPGSEGRVIPTRGTRLAGYYKHKDLCSTINATAVGKDEKRLELRGRQEGSGHGGSGGHMGSTGGAAAGLFADAPAVLAAPSGSRNTINFGRKAQPTQEEVDAAAAAAAALDGASGSAASAGAAGADSGSSWWPFGRRAAAPATADTAAAGASDAAPAAAAAASEEGGAAPAAVDGSPAPPATFLGSVIDRVTLFLSSTSNVLLVGALLCFSAAVALRLYGAGGAQRGAAKAAAAAAAGNAAAPAGAEAAATSAAAAEQKAAKKAGKGADTKAAKPVAPAPVPAAKKPKPAAAAPATAEVPAAAPAAVSVPAPAPAPAVLEAAAVAAATADLSEEPSPAPAAAAAPAPALLAEKQPAPAPAPEEPVAVEPVPATTPAPVPDVPCPAPAESAKDAASDAPAPAPAAPAPAAADDDDDDDDLPAAAFLVKQSTAPVRKPAAPAPPAKAAPAKAAAVAASGSSSGATTPPAEADGAAAFTVVGAKPVEPVPSPAATVKAALAAAAAVANGSVAAKKTAVAAAAAAVASGTSVAGSAPAKAGAAPSAASAAPVPAASGKKTWNAPATAAAAAKKAAPAAGAPAQAAPEAAPAPRPEERQPAAPAPAPAPAPEPAVPSASPAPSAAASPAPSTPTEEAPSAVPDFMSVNTSPALAAPPLPALPSPTSFGLPVLLPLLGEAGGSAASTALSAAPPPLSPGSQPVDVAGVASTLLFAAAAVEGSDAAARARRAELCPLFFKLASGLEYYQVTELLNALNKDGDPAAVAALRLIASGIAVRVALVLCGFLPAAPLRVPPVSARDLADALVGPSSTSTSVVSALLLLTGKLTGEGRLSAPSSPAAADGLALPFPSSSASGGLFGSAGLPPLLAAAAMSPAGAAEAPAPAPPASSAAPSAGTGRIVFNPNAAVFSPPPRESSAASTPASDPTAAASALLSALVKGGAPFSGGLVAPPPGLGGAGGDLASAAGSLLSPMMVPGLLQPSGGLPPLGSATAAPPAGFPFFGAAAAGLDTASLLSFLAASGAPTPAAAPAPAAPAVAGMPESDFSMAWSDAVSGLAGMGGGSGAPGLAPPPGLTQPVDAAAASLGSRLLLPRTLGGSGSTEPAAPAQLPLLMGGGAGEPLLLPRLWTDVTGGDAATGAAGGAAGAFGGMPLGSGALAGGDSLFPGFSLGDGSGLPLGRGHHRHSLSGGSADDSFDSSGHAAVLASLHLDDEIIAAGDGGGSGLGLAGATAGGSASSSSITGLASLVAGVGARGEDEDDALAAANATGQSNGGAGADASGASPSSTPFFGLGLTLGSLNSLLS